MNDQLQNHYNIIQQGPGVKNSLDDIDTNVDVDTDADATEITNKTKKKKKNNGCRWPKKNKSNLPDWCDKVAEMELESRRT